MNTETMVHCSRRPSSGFLLHLLWLPVRLASILSNTPKDLPPRPRSTSNATLLFNMWNRRAIHYSQELASHLEGSLNHSLNSKFRSNLLIPVANERFRIPCALCLLFCSLSPAIAKQCPTPFRYGVLAGDNTLLCHSLWRSCLQLTMVSTISATREDDRVS